MNSTKYVNKKLILRTLTPVFIGNDQGSNLSPVTDFIVKGENIHLINQTKLESLLNTNIHVLDKFVFAVKNEGYKFDLEQFIREEINSDIEKLIKKTLEAEGYIGKNTIKAFITSNGKPFIPGSTIKGAIRTAIIYNYLITSGEYIITNIFSTAKKIHTLSEIKKVRGLSEKDFKELNKLRKKLKKGIFNEFKLFKPKEKQIDKNGQSFLIDLGHDFRHLQISDSKLLELTQTKVIELKREYLTQSKTKTSQWAQVLKKQVKVEFNFKIEKDFKDNFLKPINEKTYYEIFKMINKFSLDVIEFELERFHDFVNTAKNKEAIRNKVHSISEFYQRLKDIIISSNNKWAIIRIGGGKTYFDNSIGLALYKKDSEKFKQFRKSLGFWKHRSGKFVEEASPITRTFYLDNKSNGYLPIGWTVIYFDDDIETIETLFSSETNPKGTSMQTNKKLEDENIDYSKLENLGRVTHTKPHT